MDEVEDKFVRQNEPEWGFGGMNPGQKFNQLRDKVLEIEESNVTQKRLFEKELREQQLEALKILRDNKLSFEREKFKSNPANVRLNEIIVKTLFLVEDIDSNWKGLLDGQEDCADLDEFVYRVNLAGKDLKLKEAIFRHLSYVKYIRNLMEMQN